MDANKHETIVNEEFDAEERELLSVKDVAALEGEGMVAAFNETKKIISAQTAVVTAIKDKMGPQVKANGNRLVLYVDGAGVGHGLQFVPGDPGYTAKAIEAACVRRGMTAEEIASFKKECKGAPGFTFGSF